jgi:hypothetical protein
VGAYVTGKIKRVKAIHADQQDVLESAVSFPIFPSHLNRRDRLRLIGKGR